MNNDITHEEAIEAGRVCGALLFGYLWQLQHESAGPATLQIRSPDRKKYLTVREAAQHLGVGKTKFYEYREDKDFPKPHPETGKYLTAEIDKYDRKLKSKKA